jgi:glycosyltransferase involved in cell wall biosynthesis
VTPSVLFAHEIHGLGGAERYLELLTGGLRSRGVPTAAVIFGVDRHYGRRAADRLVPTIERLRYVEGRARPGPIWSMARRAQADLLHWNFPDPWSFRGASFLLLPWGRPSVITDHLPMLTGASRLVEQSRSLANRRIAAAIVVGEASAVALEHRWRRPPPVHVVRNGVPRRDRYANVRARRAPGPALLFVGRLEPQKNPLFAVAVVEALLRSGHPATLRIVGDGSLGADLRREVTRRGVDGVVTYAGQRDDAAGEMEGADVLLAPSRYEGLPFTPLEALAAGLPVVASSIAPHAELAGDSGAVTLLPVDDPGRWAEAVVALTSRSGVREAALAAAARFSLDAMVEGTLAVYRGVSPVHATEF